VISGLAISAFLAFDRVNEDFKRQTAQPRPTENRASISFRMEVAGFVAGLKSRSIIKI
jgi:hypothetical protein